MKKIFIFFLIFMAFIAFPSKKLVVYTYDSFISGIGKETIEIFEKMYGCNVELLSFGDAGTVLSRLILEKNNPKADVVIGLDKPLLIKAIEYGIVEKYEPINKSLIKYPELINEYGTPFDMGTIALVYNKDTIKNPPKTFEDLLKPEYKGKIVIEDPRTSSTGLSFLFWTIAIYKDKYLDFWQKFKENLLTITPGWDEAFEMLESGEADIMVSYATDGAYSFYYYGTIKYVPVLLNDSALVQVEYASIIKNAKNYELAKRFIEFILMDDFQKRIPLNQWMLPITNVELPDVFKYVPKINNILDLDESIYKNQERILKEWSKEIIGG